MSERRAPSDWPLHDLIAERWSPRAFADRAIEREKINALFEAMRWAPSSYNEQPWNLIVATKDQPDEYEQLLGCLVEFNQNWAKAAPLLMISVTSLRFARNEKPNAHAWHDVGLGLENLALQATSMGLVTHMMAGFDADKAREAFRIPESHEATTAIAVGYPGSPDDLPDDLRKQESGPRSRKPLDTFVFTGKFGQKSPLLGNG